MALMKRRIIFEKLKDKLLQLIQIGKETSYSSPVTSEYINSFLTRGVYGIADDSCPASSVQIFLSWCKGLFLGVMKIAVDMVIEEYMAFIWLEYVIS